MRRIVGDLVLNVGCEVVVDVMVVMVVVVKMVVEGGGAWSAQVRWY